MLLRVTLPGCCVMSQALVDHLPGLQHTCFLREEPVLLNMFTTVEHDGSKQMHSAGTQSDPYVLCVMCNLCKAMNGWQTATFTKVHTRLVPETIYTQSLAYRNSCPP